MKAGQIVAPLSPDCNGILSANLAEEQTQWRLCDRAIGGYNREVRIIRYRTHVRCDCSLVSRLESPMH